MPQRPPCCGSVSASVHAHICPPTLLLTMGYDRSTPEGVWGWRVWEERQLLAAGRGSPSPLVGPPALEHADFHLCRHHSFLTQPGRCSGWGEVGLGSECGVDSFLWQEIDEMFEGDWKHSGSPPSGKDQAGGNEFNHSDLGKGILRYFPFVLYHSRSLKS